MDKKPCSSQEVEVRKGPWTMEEDLILINYITNHGEGVWNSLAKAAGLKRTGKSCRLRWLNYLRPDVRRGNITPEEQLLIMELQAKWGNRWSKIAKHLPGRTDNEIKNYWRTKIQKHVKHTDNYPTDAINSELGEHHHASSSQMMEDIGSDHQHYQYHHAIESYTPGAMMYSNNNFEAMHPSGGVGEGPSASSVISSAPMPAYHPSSDNLWTMEDVWPMHLLNNVD